MFIAIHDTSRSFKGQPMHYIEILHKMLGHPELYKALHMCYACSTPVISTIHDNYYKGYPLSRISTIHDNYYKGYSLSRISTIHDNPEYPLSRISIM